jgi:hypothetical protein
VWKAVREDERLAHALEGKDPIEGVGFPVCEKDFCGDTGAEGGDQMENIVLPRSVRRRRPVRRRLNYEG